MDALFFGPLFISLSSTVSVLFWWSIGAFLGSFPRFLFRLVLEPAYKSLARPFYSPSCSWVGVGGWTRLDFSKGTQLCKKTLIRNFDTLPARMVFAIPYCTTQLFKKNFAMISVARFVYSMTCVTVMYWSVMTTTNRIAFRVFFTGLNISKVRNSRISSDKNYITNSLCTCSDLCLWFDAQLLTYSSTSAAMCSQYS